MCLLNIAILTLVGMVYAKNRAIFQKVTKMEQSEQTLQDDLTAIGADVTAITTAVTEKLALQTAEIADQQNQITALKALVAQGGVVTQEHLDALVSNANAIRASADALLASVTAPAPPSSN